VALLRRSRPQFQPLTEAEAYARCHGHRGPDWVRLVVLPKKRPRFPADVTGESLRRSFESRLDRRTAVRQK
jgi:hypothetical protein